MNRNEIKVGQLVTVGMEVEFWNSDDTNVDYRTDRWAPFKVLEIVDAGPDYVTLNLECADGRYTGEIELDLDYDDVEPVK